MLGVGDGRWCGSEDARMSSKFSVGPRLSDDDNSDDDGGKHDNDLVVDSGGMQIVVTTTMLMIVASTPADRIARIRVPGIPLSIAGA